MKPRGNRKTVIGVVTSDKMDKTISVKVERRVKHPLYGKYLRAATVYKAHDPNSEAKQGAKVRIMETRPLSRTKRWRLVEIIQQGPGEQGPAEQGPAEAGQESSSI